MKNIRKISAAFCVIAMPAMADEQPPPKPHDKIVVYEPHATVPLKLQVGSTAIIEIGQGERTKWFLFGKPKNDVVGGLDQKDNPNTFMVNNLPIWGFEVGKTNLTITSILPCDCADPDKPGPERVYQLAVEVIAAKPDGDLADGVITHLKYIYPAQEKAAAQQKAAAAQQVAAKVTQPMRALKKAEDRLATGSFGGPRNWKYRGWGDTSVLPPLDSTSDDYHDTVFRFPGNLDVPVVYEVEGPAWCDPNHNPPASWFRAPAKHPVETWPSGDFVTAHQTAAHWRFRRGQAVADSSNCGYDPIGVNPGTGTIRSDVFRTTNAE